MRRFLIPGVVCVVAGALLALLAFGVNNQGENTSIDSRVARGIRPLAPSYNVALPILGSARTENLRDFRGKVVVLNIFASWCQPCAGEAPILEHEQHLLAGHDATILGVTDMDNASDSAAFVHQHHLTFPVIRDVSGNFVRSFGTIGVPETFVIDRRGRVAAVRRYPVDKAWLAKVLPPILAERS